MRIAFVTPRYGKEVLGGAESAVRYFAEHLLDTDLDVSVLTTCAVDIEGLHTPYSPGSALIDRVPVLRFPVSRDPRDIQRHSALTRQVSQGGSTTRIDAHAWVDTGMHSPQLYRHILERGSLYDLLIFAPYLYTTTFYGTAIWPERSIVWPCLHHEPFAHFPETRQMLNSCRGVMYNCEPERAFATKVLGVHNPRNRVVGIGVRERVGDAESFRRQYHISEPFLLYVGRLDPMKNLMELFSYFTRYKAHRTGPLKLVVLGEGPLVVPQHPDIVSIGYVDEASKWDAYAAATAVCQPSLVESFSLVLMESWLNATPVLINGNCDVTRYHVEQGQGGLYYLDFAEFAGTLDWYTAHAEGRRRLGLQGRAYVRGIYNWKAVVDRFRSALEVWCA